MRYFSTFTGIGGFELGIQQAYLHKLQDSTELTTKGVFGQGSKPKSSGQQPGRGQTATCIGYSEIDKYAIKTYEEHFKHENFGDITKINAAGLPDFDLVVGGFPCQSFSVAGKRLGFNETRGTLFFDIARILSEKRPGHLVLENVKGLLSHDSGKTFQTILGVLADLGYRVEWQLLNSKDFGVPQNRERVYIVGHLRGECGRKVFPITRAVQSDIKVYGELNSETWQKRHESIRRVHLIDGISPTIPTGTGGGVMNKIVAGTINRGAFMETDDTALTLDTGVQQAVAVPVLTPDRLVKHQNGRRFKTDGEPALTVNTIDRHGVYDGVRIRRLTPVECERLQGFPDGWTIGSDTQRYKQCGNAVTVNVVAAVMTALGDCLYD